jgi:hypothetical protein
MGASSRLLAFALAQAVALGVLHAILLRRQPPPLTAFVALGAAIGAGLGLAVTADLAWHQAGRSVLAVAWLPLVALGSFAVGAVASVAWLLLVRGGASRLGAKKTEAAPQD